MKFFVTHHEEHRDHGEGHGSEKLFPVFNENVDEGGDEEDDGDDEQDLDDQLAREQQVDQLRVRLMSADQSSCPNKSLKVYFRPMYDAYI